MFFFLFCCFWLCKCGEGCFGFSPRLFFQNHSRFVVLAYFCFFFCLPFQHSKVFFLRVMSPTLELTLSFCFSGVLFLAPLHSSFLLRSFQPVSSHPLLQSTLLSLLVVSLFYSSSLDAIFFCFRLGASFLFFSCWFLFGVLLTVVVPIFSSLGLFFLVSLSGVFGGPTLVKVVFFIVLGYAKGFSLRKKTEKMDKSNNRTHGASKLKVRCVARLLTGRGGALN